MGQRRRKDYDQLIMKMICSSQKKDIADNQELFLQIKQQHEGFIKQKNTNKQVKVFGWGLNDKDQLGGLKGSKVKGGFIYYDYSFIYLRTDQPRN